MKKPNILGVLIVTSLLFSAKALIINSNAIRTTEDLMVVGDFNGDTKSDTLREVYVNRITKAKISKINIEKCDSRICVDEFIQENNPGSYLVWVGQQDTLFISITEEDYPTFGITGILNIGDVDKDPGDEIGVVTGWCDHSLVSECVIWSYKHHGWEIIKEFTIHEELIFDGSTQKTILIRDNRNCSNWDSKGIFHFADEVVYYYEYDGVNGKIIERNF